MNEKFSWCADKEAGWTYYSLIDANLKVLMSLNRACFIGPDVGRAAPSIIIEIFLFNVPKKLLIFWHSTFSASHQFVKVVSKRKHINLLTLAVFPYKAQFVTDLRTVKAEPAEACLTSWFSIILPSKTSSLSTMHMHKQLLASQLAQLKLSLLTRDGHARRTGAATIFNE